MTCLLLSQGMSRRGWDVESRLKFMELCPAFRKNNPWGFRRLTTERQAYEMDPGLAHSETLGEFCAPTRIALTNCYRQFIGFMGFIGSIAFMGSIGFIGFI
jgi:hypothetical protein